VQASQDAKPGRVREASCGERGRPCFDLLGTDVLQALLAEGRQQVGAHDRLVAAQRRGLAGAVLLQPAHVVRGCVGERGAGADHSRQLAASRFGQHLVEPRLRRATGEEAWRGSTALAPCRSDAPFDLAAIREAVLGVPDAAAFASRRKTWPEIGVERWVAITD
jgi:hypothetical protein